MTDLRNQPGAFDKAQARWGAFRRFLAARPLSGFWTGVALGALAGLPFGALLF